MLPLRQHMERFDRGSKSKYTKQTKEQYTDDSYEIITTDFCKYS